MIEKVNQAVRYLSHILKVRSKYRIHSPFVYNFYKEVLTDRTQAEEFPQIEHIRNDLLHRYRFIKKVDLGARSGEMRMSQRFVRVRDIARNSSVSRKKGELLYRIVRYYKPRSIIELGTSLGISTMYLAAAYRNSHVSTIEGCRDTLSIATHNFTRMGLSNIEEVVGNFDDKLPEVLKELGTVDLVFFDGNHKRETTLRYFDECLGHITNNTIFIFDDINWSRGMKSAWQNIREHPTVRVSIDLYSMGLVFFRKELSKEDFILNF